MLRTYLVGLAVLLFAVPVDAHPAYPTSDASSWTDDGSGCLGGVTAYVSDSPTSFTCAGLDSTTVQCTWTDPGLLDWSVVLQDGSTPAYSTTGTAYFTVTANTDHLYEVY